jgi:hypothetical protein
MGGIVGAVYVTVAPEAVPGSPPGRVAPTPAPEKDPASPEPESPSVQLTYFADVPVTVAVKVWVPLTASDVIWGEMVMVAIGGVLGPPPQLVIRSVDEETRARKSLRKFIERNLRTGCSGAF